MADDKRTLPGTKIRDLTGETFGRLTVLEYLGKQMQASCIQNGRRYFSGRDTWRCLCICGTEKVLYGKSLRSGNTASCGCLHRERNRAAKRATRITDHPLYDRWCQIRKRCYVETDAAYPLYGGRGIDVCQEWRVSFDQFVEDIGLPPFAGAKLDRIDNNRGYWPDNVRWATQSDQMNNTRVNVLLTYADKTQTQAQWEREYGLKKGTIRARLELGWSLERALTTPSRFYPRKETSCD